MLDIVRASKGIPKTSSQKSLTPKGRMSEARFKE
jgi:hypothetical protein